MPKISDLTNYKFGKLTVLERAECPANYSRQRVSWLCLCECGNRIVYIADSLRAGLVTSCGCAKKERCSELGKAQLKHGHFAGKKASPTMTSWQKMMARCTNPNSTQYQWYGARGISVDSRWLHFNNFIEDMGLRPPGRTLDRIDNDGAYCKANCRWATPAEQAQNRRPRSRCSTNPDEPNGSG